MVSPRVSRNDDRHHHVVFLTPQMVAQYADRILKVTTPRGSTLVIPRKLVPVEFGLTQKMNDLNNKLNNKQRMVISTSNSKRATKYCRLFIPTTHSKCICNATVTRLINEQRNIADLLSQQLVQSEFVNSHANSTVTRLIPFSRNAPLG